MASTTGTSDDLERLCGAGRALATARLQAAPVIGPSPATCVALAAVGAAAGLVNTLAGGGGLLVMPILLCIGLSPAQAIATNKLQAMLGLSTAVASFTRVRLIDRPFATRVARWALVGAVAGALLVQQVPREWLGRAMPILLLAAAGYTLASPRLDQVRPCRLPAGLYAGTAGVGLGFYDGFFGPGVGSLWLLTLLALTGQSLARATAHANVFNLVGTVSAFAVLALGGQVVLWAGLCLGAGQILGASIGARLVIASATPWVRPLMVLTTIGAAAKLMLG